MTETKPDTEPKPDAKVDAKPEAKPAPTTGAPEKYADFTAPEGHTLDAKAIEAAAPIFKELGLTQDQAQKLVSLQAKMQIDAAGAPAAAYEALRTDWRTKTTADPDMKAAISGGKTGLDAVKLDINRALNSINDPALVTELKTAMDTTGVGDHPAFIKTLWKLSQFVTEGKHVSGNGPSKFGQQAPGSTDKPSPAKAMYPNLPG